MTEMYKRPDRAAIAARVEAELAAEQPAGRAVPVEAFAVGGGGWDSVGRRELDDIPDPPPAYCGRCSYLVTAIGHQVACGE